MTWSFALTENGDLALGSKGFATVTNERKLVQDLKYEILQKRGTYRYEREYGSNLEEDVIGNVPQSFEDIEIQIESEIAEVVRRHQRRQLARAKYDKMTYGAATLTAKEVVMSFTITKLIQNQTSVEVEVELMTAGSNPEMYPIKLSLNV